MTSVVQHNDGRMQAINAAAHQRSKGQSSSADSIELQVAGNRTGNLPQFSKEFTYITRPAELSNLRLKDRSNMAKMQNIDNLPSKDTSRSPIPIDPESYKNMNK